MSVLDRGIRGNVQSTFNTIGADTIAYGNARMPASAQGSISKAIDYLFAAVYPNYKGTVATPANLPTTAQANDWYLVTDDGDGKSAGYVWTVTSSGGAWIKRYDVDWSYEQILADTINRTQYMYASKYGITDRDATGNALTGQFAGQHIYGGDQTGQNMILSANYFDSTGLILVTNSVLPTVDNTLNLGSMTYRYHNAYFGGAVGIGTTTISSSVINDTSGSFSFANLVLSTTNTVNGSSFIAGTMTVSPGSILDTSGAISFGSSNLTTNGTITGATGSKLADITFSAGTFNTATAAGFNFSNKALSGIGALTSLTVATGEVDVGNLVLSGQTIKSISPATGLTLQALAGGNATTVQINSKAQLNFDALISGSVTVSGNSAIAGSETITGNLKLSATASVGTIQTLAGDLILTPFTSQLQITGLIKPDADGTRDLGTSTLRFQNLYLKTGISDGTNSTSTNSLLSLRNILTGVGDKMSLFFDAASGTFLPSIADTEIVHSTISGLTTGDAGHTQFVMLGGRSGGQTINGDTVASGNLVLSSTSNATKGLVLLTSDLAPNSDATYASGWSGTNLGGVSRNFNNMYSKGIHYGLRFDQYNGSANYPASSGQNIGRVIWDTSTNQLVVDNGTTWSKVGQQKFQQDVTFDGSTFSQTVVVSASISDARTAIWQLLDNTNGFEQIFCKMTKTQTQVTITASPNLPSGSYRLIGFN